METAHSAEEGETLENATASTAGDEEQYAPSVPPESQVESSRESSRTAMRAMLFGDESTLAQPANVVESADTLPADEAAEPAEFPAAAETEQAAAVEAVSEEPASLLETATPPAEEAISTETAEIEGAALPDLESPVEVESEPPAVSVGPESEAETAWVIDQETTVTPETIGPVVAPEPARSGNGTIVIIEDDDQVGKYSATLLGGNGCTIEVATDGISGVDLCTRLRPQVILLDVMMPRQNGILVLQTLRATEETRDTPVVVLSNFSEPTLIRRALQLGALEYVIKTHVDGAALLEAIPRWMNREKAFAS